MGADILWKKIVFNLQLNVSTDCRIQTENDLILAKLGVSARFFLERLAFGILTLIIWPHVRPYIFSAI